MRTRNSGRGQRVNYADYPLSEYESGHLDVGGTGGCKLEVVRRTFQVKNSDFSECFYDPAQQVVRLPWFDIVCAILRRQWHQATLLFALLSPRTCQPSQLVAVHSAARGY